MSIVDGLSQVEGGTSEGEDELETRLIVRLHCQHGQSGLLHFPQVNKELKLVRCNQDASSDSSHSRIAHGPWYSRGNE